MSDLMKAVKAILIRIGEFAWVSFIHWIKAEIQQVHPQELALVKVATTKAQRKLSSTCAA